jgi:hypothetical protein
MSESAALNSDGTGTEPSRARALLLVGIFGVAIFLSAALLFSVQPLFTKMVLPLLGGSPAVWNTCLLFFQTLLLAGYLYAHLTSRWLSARNQAILHFDGRLHGRAFGDKVVGPHVTVSNSLNE